MKRRSLGAQVESQSATGSEHAGAEHFVVAAARDQAMTSFFWLGDGPDSAPNKHRSLYRLFTVRI